MCNKPLSQLFVEGEGSQSIKRESRLVPILVNLTDHVRDISNVVPHLLATARRMSESLLLQHISRSCAHRIVHLHRWECLHKLVPAKDEAALHEGDGPQVAAVEEIGGT